MKSIRSLLATALFAASVPSHAADLVVDVKGIGETKGQVIVAVYDKAEQWLRKATHLGRVPADSASVTVTIPGLQEGAYAVSLFHDVDGNGKLDMNPMRIPIEPVGFSNDATGSFGPAPFDAARFEVPAAGTRITVTLKGI